MSICSRIGRLGGAGLAGVRPRGVHVRMSWLARKPEVEHGGTVGHTKHRFSKSEATVEFSGEEAFLKIAKPRNGPNLILVEREVQPIGGVPTPARLLNHWWARKPLLDIPIFQLCKRQTYLHS